jgi:D-serine deaminase-like pyridoxal phosphate-dependent protein
MLYTVCIAPDKLPRAAAIARRAPGLALLVDNVEVARAVATASRAGGLALKTWIELDVGGHRTGVAPDDPALIDIARARRGDAVLEGVLSHAGQAYSCTSVAEIASLAEAERTAVVGAIARLNSAGFALLASRSLYMRRVQRDQD